MRQDLTRTANWYNTFKTFIRCTIRKGTFIRFGLHKSGF